MLRLLHNQDEVMEFVRKGINHQRHYDGAYRERMAKDYVELIRRSDCFSLMRLRDEGVLGFESLDLRNDECRKLLIEEIRWLLPGMVLRIPYRRRGEFNGHLLLSGVSQMFGDHRGADHYEKTIADFLKAHNDVEVVCLEKDPDWLIIRKLDRTGTLEKVDEEEVKVRDPLMFSDRRVDPLEEGFPLTRTEYGSALSANQYHLLIDVRASLFLKQYRSIPESRLPVVERLMELGLVEAFRDHRRNKFDNQPRVQVRFTEKGLNFIGVFDPATIAMFRKWTP